MVELETDGLFASVPSGELSERCVLIVALKGGFDIFQLFWSLYFIFFDCRLHED